MKKKTTLWTKNFTIITIGTIISAFGGAAMNIALTLVVFDHTQSTMLTGLYASLTMIPCVVFPILLAPYIDSHKRKNIIVNLDFVLGTIYLLFGFYIMIQGFDYITYIVFGLITGSISSIYTTAYEAFYPELIPKGYLQKGYSISSLIYPTVTIIATPTAAYFYTHFDIQYLFYMEASLLFLSSLFERFIQIDESALYYNRKKFQLKTYLGEITGGIEYLKKEKGIRNLYQYMAITNAAGSSNQLMLMSHFQSTSGLTTTMYSLLISAETLGRFLGGLLHYFIKIPSKVKYVMTKNVYLIYVALDSSILFMPYFFMLISKFSCGFLGINTATTRAVAVQSYIPVNMRARINSVLNVIIMFGITITNLIAGFLGEFLSFKLIIVLFGFVEFLGIIFLIIRNKGVIEPILTTEDGVSK